MSAPRLTTDFWLSAGLRRCSNEGIGAFVVARGDPTAGTVAVKLNLLGPGFRILSQITDLDGRTAWLPAFDGRTVDEAEADAWLDRARKRDPDLWIVEIEDRAGRNPFEPG